MGVVEIAAEVDIAQSPEVVFDYCSDHRHEPEWNPMMTHIEVLTNGPVGVGTRYKTEFVKGPTMVMECTEYERPLSWAMVGTSTAMKASGDNRVIPTDEGALLVMRMELELHGLFRLAAPLIRRRLRRSFEQDVRNIKARLEVARNEPPHPVPG
jgi:uncharacterized protein YndB with AHSA1/START domain